MAEAETAPMDVDEQEQNKEHVEAPSTSQKRAKKTQQDKTEHHSIFDATPVEGKRQRKTVEVFKPDEPRRKADGSKPQEVRGKSTALMGGLCVNADDRVIDTNMYVVCLTGCRGEARRHPQR